MIRISQIDDNLSIYKENVVVLLGTGDGFEDIYNLLKLNKIEISFICDTIEENIGTTYEDIEIISHLELNERIRNKNVLIQISSSKMFDKELKDIEYKHLITFNEAHKILHLISFISLQKLYPDNPIFSYRDPKNSIDEEKLVKNFIDLSDNYPVFIVNPTKTADYTLQSTFDKYNIPNCYVFNTPTIFNSSNLINKKIKLITSVRDPISRNISMLYQMIANNKSYLNSFNLTKNVDNFFHNGGDAQVWFDRIIDEGWINDNYFGISTFMNSFKDNIFDLSKYPFDQDKGYSIIKEGNIEVFVYQLEHMNECVKDMSDWIGQTSFNEWVLENEASSKWIANSYKQAQKDIKFSKEYFDKCYDDYWINYFYSKNDIEKFKEKWYSHIR